MGLLARRRRPRPRRRCAVRVGPGVILVDGVLDVLLDLLEQASWGSVKVLLLDRWLDLW